MQVIERSLGGWYPSIVSVNVVYHLIKWWQLFDDVKWFHLFPSMSTEIQDPEPSSSQSSLPLNIQQRNATPKISKESITNGSEPVPLDVTPIASMLCRICQTNTANEVLISPCRCKGSMAYVHLSCLERWLNQSSRSYCELCKYQYNAIETQRYGFCEALWLWINHPRNRTHVQSDFLIVILLTIVTAGLVCVCILGMQYFVIEATKFGMTRMWTKVVVCIFLGTVIVGYIVTIYLLIKDELAPWYRWWKNTVDVRLRLTASIAQGLRRQVSETDV